MTKYKEFNELHLGDVTTGQAVEVETAELTYRHRYLARIESIEGDTITAKIEYAWTSNQQNAAGEPEWAKLCIPNKVGQTVIFGHANASATE